MCQRTASTSPPPPASATAAELDARATEMERIAGQILARSRDLRDIANFMRGMKG